MKKKTMILLDELFGITLRIIVCPFVFSTILIRNLYNSVYFTIMFLIFGGEHISYVAKEKRQIYNIYEKVQELLKEKNAGELKNESDND